MIHHYPIARLQFDSGYHQGLSPDNAYDTADLTLHSDTLTAALVSLYVRCGGTDPAEFAASFQVSSTFPYRGEHYFLPLTPDHRGLVTAPGDPLYKRLKKVRWVESTLWNRLSAGETLKVEAAQVSRCGYCLLAEGDDAAGAVLRQSLEQHVAVDSLHRDDPRPYLVSRVFTASDGGLYLLYRTRDEAAEARFRRLLTLLGDQGLGGRRTVGNGLFTVSWERLTLTHPDSPSHYQLVALYRPTADECRSGLFTRAVYRLQERGGCVTDAPSGSGVVPKRSVVMVSEGSLVPTGNPLTGSVADVRPHAEFPHAVWRDGRFFGLPYLIRQSV